MWYGCTHVLEFLPKVSSILDSRVSLHKTFTVAVESTTTSRSMQGSGPCQISRGSTTVAAGMHVTDRRRQEPGKPITCQRDSKPSRPAGRRAQHGRVTQAPPKKKQKKNCPNCVKNWMISKKVNIPIVKFMLKQYSV